MMTLTTDVGDIDIMDRVQGVGGYAEVLVASEPVIIGSTRFRSLTLPALIASKRAAGRPRDHEHLIELKAARVGHDGVGGPQNLARAHWTAHFESPTTWPSGSAKKA